MDQSPNWKQEIEDLHDHFGRYFRGEVDSLERVAQVLADDFRIVSPAGKEDGRQATLDAIESGHGRDDSIVITTDGHELFLETDDVMVAGYVERQRIQQNETSRLSTVVFRKDPDAPNGVVLVRVHETWEPGSP